MTDQEQEHTAELVNAAMKPFEGREWYANVAPRIFDMITSNFEFKKEIPTMEAVKLNAKETLESWNTLEDFNELVIIVADFTLTNINNLTPKQ